MFIKDCVGIKVKLIKQRISNQTAPLALFEMRAIKSSTRCFCWSASGLSDSWNSRKILNRANTLWNGWDCDEICMGLPVPEMIEAKSP
jgi:hypothetical protein